MGGVEVLDNYESNFTLPKWLQISRPAIYSYFRPNFGGQLGLFFQMTYTPFIFSPRFLKKHWDKQLQKISRGLSLY